MSTSGSSNADDQALDHSRFATNPDRPLEGEIAAKSLEAVVSQPKVKRLLSSERFSMDGTLLEAWASIRSFRRKGEATMTHRAVAFDQSPNRDRRPLSKTGKLLSTFVDRHVTRHVGYDISQRNGAGLQSDGSL